MRKPPQTLLDIDPSLTIRGASTAEALSAGGPLKVSSTRVSSSTNRVSDPFSPASKRVRSAARIIRPVGLLWSSTR